VEKDSDEQRWDVRNWLAGDVTKQSWWHSYACFVCFFGFFFSVGFAYSVVTDFQYVNWLWLALDATGLLISIIGLLYARNRRLEYFRSLEPHPS